MGKAKINYVIGDATQPIGSGNKIVCHCNNDIGNWGRGFVLAVSKRWPIARDEYFKWFESKKEFLLGQVQYVQVEPEIWIANLIGQKGIRPLKGVPPIRYDAIQEGFESLAKFARTHKASVHMPRIGCGLAGGEWNTVEEIIETKLIASGTSVFIYDLS